MVTIQLTRDPVEGAILNKPEKIRLLDELERCLDEWSRAASAQAPLNDPRVAQLLSQTIGFQPLARTAGFGGIAVHIETLRERVDSTKRATGIGPFLVPLRELISAARESLSDGDSPERSGQHADARWQPIHAAPYVGPLGASEPSAQAAFVPAAPAQGHSNLARTHVIDAPGPAPCQIPSGLQQSSPPRQPPQTPPALLQAQQPAQSSSPPQPPPMLGASVFLQQHAPNLALDQSKQPHGAPAAVSFPAAPPHLNQSISLAQQLDGSAGMPQIALPEFHSPALARPLAQDSAELVAKEAAAPRSLGAAGSLPSNAPVMSPNLRVRTMFGLRAFASRKSDPNPVAMQLPAAPMRDEGDQKASSFLRLKRGSRNPSQAPAAVRASAPPDAPRLLNHSLAGLPSLPPMVNPPANDARSSGLSQNVSRLDVLGDIVRFRGRDRRRGGSAPSPALLRNREQGSSAWRIGALAIAILALVLGGLATLIIVLTRNPRQAEADVAEPKLSPSAKPAATPASAGMPQARLITENESLRALLSQMHGRGKESAELSALVDEEAALIASSLSPDKCKGSPAACQAMAAMHASVLGAQGTKRISQRRATGSMDRVRSRWLVGLKLPEIPVEDDPRVERSLQFYTENPVGRETFQSMLFRCGAYRDLIQSTLVRYELPTDLWAIVFVESGCSPQATSPVGAAGLWQFMPATGRAYHLRIKDEVIDERRSPPKSTEAAVRYLRDIREKLMAYNGPGVWDLMFGSYNLGPFGMIARLERVGGTGIGFWDLVDAKMLPDETAMYAPAIQAVALILNNLQRYKFSAVQMRTPQLTSDLEVPPGTRLSLVARAASMSTRDLRSMNLDISGESTPDIPNLAIQVPKDVVWQARDTLKDLIANQDQMDLCVPPTFDWGRQRFTKEMAAACLRKLATKNR